MISQHSLNINMKKIAPIQMLTIVNCKNELHEICVHEQVRHMSDKIKK